LRSAGDFEASFVLCMTMASARKGSRLRAGSRRNDRGLPQLQRDGLKSSGLLLGPEPGVVRSVVINRRRLRARVEA
jgi:hypothetical protein